MSTDPNAARWDRIAALIGEAVGQPVTVDTKTGSEGYGRQIRHYTTRSISYRLPNGWRVGIHDAWWRKNPDVWIGYQTFLEDREGIIKGERRPTKSRSEAVRNVAELVLAGVGRPWDR